MSEILEDLIRQLRESMNKDHVLQRGKKVQLSAGSYNLVETGGKSKKCLDCHLKFSSDDEFQAHQTNCRNNTCDTCSKRCEDKNILRKHCESKHGTIGFLTKIGKSIESMIN